MQRVYIDGVASHTNSLSALIFCRCLLHTVWTLIRPDKMSRLIWIQTVSHSDHIPEIYICYFFFLKKSADSEGKKYEQAKSQRLSGNS